MATKVFYCTPTGRVRGWLRRFTWSSQGHCPVAGEWGHDAHVRVFDSAPESEEATGGERFDKYPKTDSRWPTQCACGYVFQDTDQWQFTTRGIYRREDTGAEFVFRDCENPRESLPVGAMYDANWYELPPGLERRVGRDGLSLQVVVPGNHTWCVDARANNCDSPCQHCGVPYLRHKNETCTNPGDGTNRNPKGSYVDAQPDHYCWVRHGDPRAGHIHVDKAGLTCGAGAGSILTPGDKWHGFLHHDHLTP